MAVREPWFARWERHPDAWMHTRDNPTECCRGAGEERYNRAHFVDIDRKEQR